MVKRKITALKPTVMRNHWFDFLLKLNLIKNKTKNFC